MGSTGPASPRLKALLSGLTRSRRGMEGPGLPPACLTSPLAFQIPLFTHPVHSTCAHLTPGTGDREAKTGPARAELPACRARGQTEEETQRRGTRVLQDGAGRGRQAAGSAGRGVCNIQGQGRPRCPPPSLPVRWERKEQRADQKHWDQTQGDAREPTGPEREAEGEGQRGGSGGDSRGLPGV